MDVVDQVPGCGPGVHDSLMLSAEATIRAWEAIVEPDAGFAGIPLPSPPGVFDCDGGSP